MNKDEIIRDMVEEFVKNDKPFTSVDIGNSIKRKTLNMNIRNRDVAIWLRDNVNTDSILQDYDTVPISVNNKQSTATLYFPHWTDPEDYDSRDQKALGPDDLIDLQKQAGMTIKAPVISTDDNIKDKTVDDGKDEEDRYKDSKVDIADLFDDGDQYNPDGNGVRLKKRLASIDRLWIPSDIVKAIGLHPGDVVDISKVKIHSGKLNPELKVHYDGRFAIPRRCVGYGTDPIKVILKGDLIYFEKE